MSRNKTLEYVQSMNSKMQLLQKSSGSAEVLALLDYLHQNLQTEKNLLADAQADDVPRIQGRCQAYTDLIRKIERTPMERAA